MFIIKHLINNYISTNIIILVDMSIIKEKIQKEKQNNKLKKQKKKFRKHNQVLMLILLTLKTYLHQSHYCQ